LGRSTESVDGVGKSINSICVVEGLSSKNLEKGGVLLQRSAVVNVGIRLDYPYKFLTGVVEVELDLVGRGTNRFVTCELNLLDEVFVRVLGHLATLIGVKEDVVYVKGSSYKGLLVCCGYRYCGGACSGGKCGYSPQALTDGTEIDVDLDLVVLKGNKRKSKSGVAAVPEHKGNVESGLRKSVTGSAYLGGASRGSTGSGYSGESGVTDVSKSCGVSYHLVVTILLFLGEGKLVPDVHPITVLTVDALASNLNFYLGDQLLSGAVQPTGIYVARSVVLLVDLGKSHLKVCAVGKITISADCACYAAAEIGLARECLLNTFHSKVSVASVRYLPEGNFGGSSKENVLGAIGDKLHKSTSHFSL
jgi:hypothetical protein